jgi:hypothetical protein
MLKVSSGAQCTLRERRPAVSQSRPRLQATRCGRCWRKFANRDAAYSIWQAYNVQQVACLSWKAANRYQCSLTPQRSRLVVMCFVACASSRTLNPGRLVSAQLS